MATWKPVLGYEGLYAVSRDGRVKRLRGFWGRADRPLKLHVTHRGYVRVRLCNRDGRNGRRFLVHRLVWQAFRGRLPKELTINHRNGIATDNRLDNLEPATMSEQMIHAYATGLQVRAKGEARGRVAKLTDETVREIRRLYVPGRVTYAMLAARFGVSAACILTVVRRLRWTHL